MRALNVVLIAVAVGAAAFAVYRLSALEQPAPEVTFVSIEGERIRTADLRGKVTLVEFWATDCAVCVREMPEMVALYRRYGGQGFDTIAVAMRHDPPNYVLHYAKKAALPFTIALDPMGELAAAFGDVRATPTRFLIDKRGNIVARMVGSIDFAGLRNRIEKELAEPAARLPLAAQPS